MIPMSLRRAQDKRPASAASTRCDDRSVSRSQGRPQSASTQNENINSSSQVVAAAVGFKESIQRLIHQARDKLANGETTYEDVRRKWNFPQETPDEIRRKARGVCTKSNNATGSTAAEGALESSNLEGMMSSLSFTCYPQTFYCESSPNEGPAPNEGFRRVSGGQCLVDQFRLQQSNEYSRTTTSGEFKIVLDLPSASQTPHASSSISPPHEDLHQVSPGAFIPPFVPLSRENNSVELQKQQQPLQHHAPLNAHQIFNGTNPSQPNEKKAHHHVSFDLNHISVVSYEGNVSSCNRSKMKRGGPTSLHDDGEDDANANDPEDAVKDESGEYLSIRSDGDEAEQVKPAAGGTILGDHMFDDNSDDDELDEGDASSKLAFCGGAVRRRLGLPPNISKQLVIQTHNDSERTVRRICLACRGQLDRNLLRPVSVLRLTNESMRSVFAQTEHEAQRQLRAESEEHLATKGAGASSTSRHLRSRPSSAGTASRDFHCFAKHNVMFECLAGITKDPYGLGRNAFDKMSEAERSKWSAFAGQSKRGMPAAGLDVALSLPCAIIFEPSHVSDFDSLLASQLRVRSLLKVMLVGHVSRVLEPEQSVLGHELNPQGLRILATKTACTLDARTANEREQRKLSRRRRDEKEGKNPHYIRKKPQWAAALGNSVFASDKTMSELMLSATTWLGDGVTAGGKKRRELPPSLKILLEEQKALVQRPLRPEKELNRAVANKDFIAHQELYFTPQYIVFYEEPDAGDDEAVIASKNEDCSEDVHVAGGGTALAHQRRRKKAQAVDPEVYMNTLRDVKKKKEEREYSVIEYTTRWGVPIDTVSNALPSDVWVRKWSRMPESVVGKQILLPQILEVCERGAVAIDVKNKAGEIEYRHSFTFGTLSLSSLQSGHAQ